MTHPETQRWYDAPLEQAGQLIDQREDLTIRGGGLIIEDDGWVRYDGILRYDLLLEGGTAAHNDHFAQFTEVRERLGLRFDPDSVRDTDLGSFQYVTGESFSIGFIRSRVNDREAMFLIALPLATQERPLEKVLEEIRTCGRLGLASFVAPAEAVPEVVQGADLLHETVNFDYVGRGDRWQLADKLAESPAVMAFAGNFARYKQLMKHLPASNNRQADIKELVRLEGLFEGNQHVANAAMRLGNKKRYREQEWWIAESEMVSPANYVISLALQIGNINDPRFVNRYPHVPYTGVPKDMPVSERKKLELLILPKNYYQERCDLASLKR